MKLKIKNGLIVTVPEGIVVGAIDYEILGSMQDEIERTIELGSELIEPVIEFVEQVNSGTLKARSAVRKFENLIEKYPSNERYNSGIDSL